MVPFIFILVGWAVNLVGFVLFIIAAFRVRVLWGLAVLFLPFANVVFLIKYWPEAKRGFLLSIVGIIVSVAATSLMPHTNSSPLRGVWKSFGVRGLEAPGQSKGPRMPASYAEDQAGLNEVAAPVEQPAAEPEPSQWLSILMTDEADKKSVEAVSTGTAGQYVGMKVEEMKKQLGKPRAEMTIGKQKVYRYPGLELISDDGVTVSRQKALGR